MEGQSQKQSTLYRGDTIIGFVPENIIANSLGVTGIDLYSIAMQNLAKQQQKMGELSDNNAEKLQRWKALFEEIKETIGKGIWWIMDQVINPLIAGIETLGTVFARVVSRMGALWDWMRSIVSGLWNWVKSGFTGSIADVFTGATQDLFKQLGILDTAFDEQMAEIVNKYNKRTGMVTPSAPSKTSSSANTGAGNDLVAQIEALKQIKAMEQSLQADISHVDADEKKLLISPLDALEKRKVLLEGLLATQKKYVLELEALNKSHNTITDPKVLGEQNKLIGETTQKLTEANIKIHELTGTFTEGFGAGIKKMLFEMKSTFQQAVEFAQATAQAMGQAFSDFFFDMMTGKLKHFSDYFKSFMEAVSRAMANVFAQRLTSGLAGGISTWQGSSGSSTNSSTGAGDIPVTAHSGGLIMHAGGYVPRFHIGGLSSDERPAILQTGEYVVSRKGVAALDKLNKGDVGGGVNVVVNVENKSSQPVNAQSGSVRYDAQAKAFVVGVILNDLEYGGPIRSGISGVR